MIAIHSRSWIAFFSDAEPAGDDTVLDEKMQSEKDK